MDDRRVTTEITKVLSANDLGLTGSHQAGILIPKAEEVLSFFPRLDETMLNPSARISCLVPSIGAYCDFRFVHYNNKVHGEGTRNEYRLTRMTKALRLLDAREGDSLRFTRDRAGRLEVTLEPRLDPSEIESPLKDTYTLAGGWTIRRTERVGGD